MFTIFYPTWLLLHKSNLKLATVTYGEDLAIMLNDNRRKLIKSEWYQQNWGFRVTLDEGSDSRKMYRTKQGAFFFATSVGGTITGTGYDMIIVDDLQKPQEMYSEAYRKNTERFYDETLPTRFNTPSKAYLINIQQRLHYEDISGYIMRREKDLYNFIILPMIARKDEEWKSPFSEDVVFKRKKGDLLWPSRWGKDEVSDLKRKKKMWKVQMQQNPEREQGEKIDLNDLQRYEKGERPTQMDGYRYILSMDANFKKLQSADPVAIGIFLTNGVNTYIVEMDNQGRGIKSSLKKIRKYHAKYPITGILVEDKANGSAIMELLEEELPGIIPIEPAGNKRSRLESASTYIESHNIFIPNYYDSTWTQEDWVDDFTTELSEFPGGDHDDMVDCFSQAIIWIHLKGTHKKISNVNREKKWYVSGMKN